MSEKLTKDELRQIFYINREIIMWQRKRDELRYASLVKSPTISDMPMGGQRRGIEDLAIEFVEYETIINGLLAKLQIQHKRIIEFINGIDDSLMRQIIFYRHISCMTWNEVANSIGGGNTEDSVKQAYSRFTRGLK